MTNLSVNGCEVRVAFRAGLVPWLHVSDLSKATGRPSGEIRKLAGGPLVKRLSRASESGKPSHYVHYLVLRMLGNLTIDDPNDVLKPG